MILQSNDRKQGHAENVDDKSIIERLRDYDNCNDDDVDEAADMLEFFFGQMQMHSPKMGGQHSYRFRGGWPMSHCVGPTAEDAVRAAIAEIQRDKGERRGEDTGNA